MTVLAAITLSSTKRSAPLFARAFSARSFGGFQQKSNNLILNQKDGQHTIQRSAILSSSSVTSQSASASASALFFSTESDEEKPASALGATVEDDLDTALNEILGAAFDEAGSTTEEEEEVGAFEAKDDEADADSDSDAPSASASVSATEEIKVDFTDPKFLSTSNPYWIAKGMDQRLIDTLSAKGITTFTEVQGKAFEPVLAGRDVIGRSRTGTGKTIAFGFPTIHRIAEMAKTNGNMDSYGKMRRGRGVSFLVLCPTRELARQVGDELSLVGKPLNLYTTIFHGGVSYDPQVSRRCLVDVR